MPDGGDRLQAYLRGVVARLGAAQEVRVGFLEGSTEADGTSLPQVAAENEWGNPARNQPPRPFFRLAIAKHKGEWGGQLAKVLKAHDYDATKSLQLMGDLIKGELQQSIVDLTMPPLSPVTIARKGSDKPLIDTGTMLASVGVEVIES